MSVTDRGAGAANETTVPLGGVVTIDGTSIGRIERFVSRGRDDIVAFDFYAALAGPVRRLRIDTRPEADGPVFLRIARIAVTTARTLTGNPATTLVTQT